MKKTIFKLMILFLIIGCSDDESSDLESTKYEYDIIQVVGKKIIAESKIGTNNLMTLKSYSYAIDTLEIKLNSGNGSYALIISSQASDDIVTPAPKNIKCHVNYLFFSDLKDDWSENKVEKIFLESQISGYSKDFTYSECNIELNNKTDFFITNPNIPTYTTLEEKPKIEFQMKTIKSDNLYTVGEITTYKSYKYQILAKRELN